MQVIMRQAEVFKALAFKAQNEVRWTVSSPVSFHRQLLEVKLQLFQLFRLGVKRVKGRRICREECSLCSLCLQIATGGETCLGLPRKSKFRIRISAKNPNSHNSGVALSSAPRSFCQFNDVMVEVAMLLQQAGVYSPHPFRPDRLVARPATLPLPYAPRCSLRLCLLAPCDFPCQ